MASGKTSHDTSLPSTATVEAKVDSSTVVNKNGSGGTGESVVVPKRWRKLAVVASPLFTDSGEVSILSNITPVIISALSLPVSAIGVLMSLHKAISIPFGPMWSIIADRTNRKWVLIISTGIVGLATAATGLAQNFVQLLICWSVVAVFVAASLPIVTQITADLFDENSRGRANGYTAGAIALLSALLGPLMGQLSNIENGWRICFFAAGGLGVVSALCIIWFQDPGVGATEPSLRKRTAKQRAANRLTWRKTRDLLKIRTLQLMLGQRLLAGQLLIAPFGVLFLVETYDFSTAQAAIITAPFGVTYMIGTFAGGNLADYLHIRNPRRGRVVLLQGAQFGIALGCLLGTQIDWHFMWAFGILWGLMGFMQGLNPGVNRPIVMAVVPPELRGAAFALMLSVFEAVAHIAFNLIAGFLGDSVGLQAVMLWLPGILMVVNGVYCTLLYRCYPKDVDQLEAQLRERAAAEAAHESGEADITDGPEKPQS